MGFNINHYTRLRQIAFFVPNVIREKYETEYSLPFPISFPIEDKNIRDKFIGLCISASHTNSDSSFNVGIDCMKITTFEFKMFLVCLNIYMDLEDLFSPYKKDFTPHKKTNKKREYGLEDDPESFYKSIPQDTFTKEMIKEKSQGLFRSVKKACHFYCMFTPSYCLYKFSVFVKQHKSEFPLLVYLRDELANYLCSFPVESFSKLTKNISDLIEAIEIYDTCKKAFSEIEEEDRLYWSQWEKTAYDGITIKCFNVVKDLSGDNNTKATDLPANLVLRRLFQEEFDPVQNEEKKRRKKISETQNKRLSERKEQVRHHLEEIAKKVQDEKITTKEACMQYFTKHESELKSINITSSRTLQNLCSHTKPNKQRADFFDRSYIKLKYSKEIQEPIDKIIDNWNKDFKDSISE